MKVLVADKFEQSGIDGLQAAGIEVLYQPDSRARLWRGHREVRGATCWWSAARR